MLLADRFAERAGEYSELRTYSVRKEKVTNVYHRVYLESPTVIIRLDIEEYESYVSFLISHRTPSGIMHYHALDDYSHIGGKMFSAFRSAAEEQAFVDVLKRRIRDHRKVFTPDKHGDQIVNHIYSFLDGFVKRLTSLPG